MTSLKQIEANRRNALKSTGPRSEQGKRRASRNAIRHGLTAETVVKPLEDMEDYRLFEEAIGAPYDAETAVERELILRLASLLWRLRRASSIETTLFELAAEWPSAHQEVSITESNPRVDSTTLRVRSPPQARTMLWKKAEGKSQDDSCTWPYWTRGCLETQPLRTRVVASSPADAVCSRSTAMGQPSVGSAILSPLSNTESKQLDYLFTLNRCETSTLHPLSLRELGSMSPTKVMADLLAHLRDRIEIQAAIVLAIDYVGANANRDDDRPQVCATHVFPRWSRCPL